MGWISAAAIVSVPRRRSAPSPRLSRGPFRWFDANTGTGGKRNIQGAEGTEARIAERLARLKEARDAAPKRKTDPPGQPKVDPMKAISEGMRSRRSALERLAEEQRDDAAD